MEIVIKESFTEYRFDDAVMESPMHMWVVLDKLSLEVLYHLYIVGNYAIRAYNSRMEDEQVNREY